MIILFRSFTLKIFVLLESNYNLLIIGITKKVIFMFITFIFKQKTYQSVIFEKIFDTNFCRRQKVKTTLKVGGRISWKLSKMKFLCKLMKLMFFQ